MRVHFNLEINRTLLFVSVGVFIALSEAIYDLVFANLAYSITGKASSVTTTYAFGYMAEIAVTLVGAGFIDRFNKWRLFIGTQIVNVCVFAIAIYFLSVHDASVGWIWMFAFCVDLIHQYARLIMFALVPFLFVRDEILHVNGILATMNGVARSVGPAIGSMAILLIGLPMSLTVSIAFMVLGLLLAVTLKSRCHENSVDEIQDVSTFKERFHESFTGASRAAITLLKSTQWRSFIGSYAACVLVIGVLSLLWIPFLRDYHLFTPVQTGYLYAVGTLGAIAGGLTTKRFSAISRLPSMIFSAHFIMLVGVIMALMIKSSLVFVGLGMFIFQFGATLYFRTTSSAIQLSVPKEVIGSWYGAIDFLSRFAGLGGILLVGWSYDNVGAYWVYSIVLSMLVISSLNWLPNRKIIWLQNSSS